MCDIINLGSILIVFNKEVQFNMANRASRLWSCPVVGKGKKSICHDFKFTRNDHSFVQILHADAYFYVGGNGFGPPKFLEPLVGQLFSINDSFFFCVLRISFQLILYSLIRSEKRQCAKWVKKYGGKVIRYRQRF